MAQTRESATTHDLLARPKADFEQVAVRQTSSPSWKEKVLDVPARTHGIWKDDGEIATAFREVEKEWAH